MLTTSTDSVKFKIFYKTIVWLTKYPSWHILQFYCQNLLYLQYTCHLIYIYINNLIKLEVGIYLNGNPTYINIYRQPPVPSCHLSTTILVSHVELNQSDPKWPRRQGSKSNASFPRYSDGPVLGASVSPDSWHLPPPHHPDTAPGARAVGNVRVYIPRSETPCSAQFYVIQLAQVKLFVRYVCVELRWPNLLMLSNKMNEPAQVAPTR